MKIKEIIDILLDIQECMDNGMYDLNEETEEEMLEAGAIDNDVEKQKEGLEEAISVLKIASKFYPPINFE